MSIARSHLDLLLRLHPRGLAWSRDASAATYQELEAWGQVLDAVDAQVDELLRALLPDHASALLSRWEELYELHRSTGLSDAARRRRVQARMTYLPDTRPLTIEDLLSRYTALEVTIVEPGPFRCDDPGSLCDDPLDVLDGAHVWWAEVDEAAARLGDTTRTELDEEIGRVRPAHTIAYLRCDDFRTNDPWSITDRDLLGA